MVFAHYFTPYPISIDNQPANSDYYTRNYLSPEGENGEHASYGGLLRDRPVPRDPRSGDWQLTDMETEVRQAMSVGIDGFTLDVLSAAGYNLDRNIRLMDAAAAVSADFKIMIVPDMTTSVGALSPSSLAALIASLGKKPSAYRLPDGRLVVSPFKAEVWSPSAWQTVMTILRTTYNITMAFMPMFLDWRSNYTDYASISYGFSDWGSRSPSVTAASLASKSAAVHALGKKWMQAVAVQDERPNQQIFDESDNLENLRQDWQGAIDGDADFVQLTTWNDYSEGTSFSPSAQHGWSFLDVSSYYIAQFKTRSVSPILRDTLYVTYRTQSVSTRPAYPETSLMALRASSVPARDMVEVMSFLTSPADVTVVVAGISHSWTAAAGIGVHTVPLGVGTVSAHAERDGHTIASLTAPYQVTVTPLVQDLQYHAIGSLR